MLHPRSAGWYCSCIRGSDVYVSLQCFCSVTRGHVTADSDGRWLRDASGHTQPQPSSPATSCQLIAVGDVSLQR